MRRSVSNCAGSNPQARETDFPSNTPVTPHAVHRISTGCVDAPAPRFLGSRTSSRMRGHLVTRHGALVLRGRGAGTFTRRSCGPGSDRLRIRVRLFTRRCAPPGSRAGAPRRATGVVRRAGPPANGAIGCVGTLEAQRPMRRLRLVGQERRRRSRRHVWPRRAAGALAPLIRLSPNAADLRAGQAGGVGWGDGDLAGGVAGESGPGGAAFGGAGAGAGVGSCGGGGAGAGWASASAVTCPGLGGGDGAADGAQGDGVGDPVGVVAAGWRRRAARAVWVSWQAQSRAQISWAMPAGWRERRTRPGPRVKTLISR